MEPYAHPRIGRAWLAGTTETSFRGLMYGVGVRDRAAITTEDIAAYVRLLKRDDGGRAFLEIMRGPVVPARTVPGAPTR